MLEENGVLWLVCFVLTRWVMICIINKSWSQPQRRVLEVWALSSVEISHEKMIRCYHRKQEIVNLGEKRGWRVRSWYLEFIILTVGRQDCAFIRIFQSVPGAPLHCPVGIFYTKIKEVSLTGACCKVYECWVGCLVKMISLENYIKIFDICTPWSRAERNKVRMSISNIRQLCICFPRIRCVDS